MSGLSADGYFGPIGSKSNDVMSGLGDLFKFRQCIHPPPASSMCSNCSNHLEIVVIIVSVFHYLGKSYKGAF